MSYSVFRFLQGLIILAILVAVVVIQLWTSFTMIMNTGYDCHIVQLVKPDDDK